MFLLLTLSRYMSAEYCFAVYYCLFCYDYYSTNLFGFYTQTMETFVVANLIPVRKVKTCMVMPRPSEISSFRRYAKANLIIEDNVTNSHCSNQIFTINPLVNDWYFNGCLVA